MREMDTEVLVIGGGINGTGIAADAASRGLSVILCEKDDLANATSSHSSKLIHGGLRYLEQYEFNLVRESLREQEILLKRAPHLVQPLEFILPYDAHLRSKWIIRVGFFFYDHLARRSKIPKSKFVSLKKNLNGCALNEKFGTGFSYYDAKTMDSRLVVSNALFAAEHGASILTRYECVQVTKHYKIWHAELHNKITHEKILVKAKAIINAGGPWVLDILNNVIHQESQCSLKLVKGSHIIVEKFYEGNQAYILQNIDGRVVFVIPYLDEFLLIGTTDIPYEGDPNKANIGEEEIQYLLASINYYFQRQVKKEDIVSSYSGVRPLYYPHAADPSKITRDYHIEKEDDTDHAPLFSVFGGKLTTYRALSENVVSQLGQYFKHLKKSKTRRQALPGGDLGHATLDAFINSLHNKFIWLPHKLARRYAGSYGTRTLDLLQDCIALEDLGEKFGSDLYQREVDFLIETEWALTIEDILWRRTKFGLILAESEIRKLKEYINAVVST
jgi:glycerol-3-phosphate dehydrogenase